MEFISYNRELETANLLFKGLFNNIRIQKQNKNVNINCVIGNRSRIFKNLENPQKQSMYKLPLIIIQRTGLTKNSDRLSNMFNEVKYATSSKKLDYNLFTPIPIDIDYTVTIASKYKSDLDMIISNFIPFFNKSVFVRSPHPKFQDVMITSQVIMEDSIQEEAPDEFDSSQDDISIVTCSFVFKTYIFCGTDKMPANIHKRDVISTFVSTYISNDVEISTEVSTIVEEIYDGLIPAINTIHMGFYPIPLLSSYTPQMQKTDEMIPLSNIPDRDWVDRFVWKIDQTKNALSNYGFYYHDHVSCDTISQIDHTAKPYDPNEPYEYEI